MKPTEDARLGAVTGNLLRAGVVASALVLCCGGAVFLARHGSEAVADQRPNPYAFEPDPERRPAKYRRPAEVFAAAGRGEGRAMVMVGVMALILTPVLRVAFTAGDRKSVV